MSSCSTTVKPFLTSARNMFDRGRNIVQQQSQQAQPTFTEATDYLDTAKNTLTAPKTISYTPTQDISKAPEYAATATKTQVDPAYYTNKWQQAEGDISEAYGKKGGYYDRMLGNLNERGLANSGEYNAQTQQMGQDLATELAQARQGIETEAMGQQSQYDESYANRMGGLLGQRTSADQFNTSNQLNVDQINQAMDWAVQTGQTDLAQELSQARNQLVSDEYSRASGEAQYADQLEADRLSSLAELLGSAEVEGQAGWEDIAAMLGYPIQKKQSTSSSSPQITGQSGIPNYYDRYNRRFLAG